MLHIHHQEGPPATKAYADACWAENPRISAGWWRELLGETAGKIALDWRTHLHNTPTIATGCNLILASPATWPEVSALLARQPVPQALLSTLVTPDIPTLLTHQPHWLIWQPSGNAEDHLAALTHLETLVKEGTLTAYGIQLGAQPLHLWLEQAANAAHQVWGRKKRPALKLLLAPLDLLDTGLLLTHTTHHKNEPVSALELAARLNLAVIVTPSALPSQQQPSPAALQALTNAAQAERTLYQSLGGWPGVEGTPIFNLLTPLAAGQSPWPTPVHWQGWKTHIWPNLPAQWASIASGIPLVTTYLQALENLLPHGEALAHTAAQPLLHQLAAHLQPYFPPIWQTEEPLTQTLALLSSIPGVGAVAVEAPFNPTPLQHLGDLPDVGSILLNLNL